MQRRFERVVDTEDAIAALLHPSGKLAEAHRAVENPRAAGQRLDLTHDHPEAMLVAGTEHFGLRAPGVCRGHKAGGAENAAGGGFYCGVTKAVLLSTEPHAFDTRTQKLCGPPVTGGVSNSVDVAPAIGERSIPVNPLNH